MHGKDGEAGDSGGNISIKVLDDFTYSDNLKLIAHGGDGQNGTDGLNGFDGIEGENGEDGR